LPPSPLTCARSAGHPAVRRLTPLSAAVRLALIRTFCRIKCALESERSPVPFPATSVRLYGNRLIALAGREGAVVKWLSDGFISGTRAFVGLGATPLGRTARRWETTRKDLSSRHFWFSPTPCWAGWQARAPNPLRPGHRDPGGPPAEMGPGLRSRRALSVRRGPRPGDGSVGSGGRHGGRHRLGYRPGPGSLRRRRGSLDAQGSSQDRSAVSDVEFAGERGAIA
jgi:hypothetical protein